MFGNILILLSEPGGVFALTSGSRPREHQSSLGFTVLLSQQVDRNVYDSLCGSCPLIYLASQYLAGARERHSHDTCPEDEWSTREQPPFTSGQAQQVYRGARGEACGSSPDIFQPFDLDTLSQFQINMTLIDR